MPLHVRKARIRSTPASINPLFPKRRLQLPGPLADVAILAAALMALMVISLLPAFHITTVQVNGQQRLNPAYIVEQARRSLGGRRLALFPQSSYFYLSTDELAQQLRIRLGTIVPLADLRVHKRFPHTLVIELVERRPMALLIASQRQFYLDANGTITGEGVPGDEKTFPALTEVNGFSFSVGDSVLPGELVNQLPSIQRELEKRNLGPVTFETAKVQCPFATLTEQPGEGTTINQPVNVNSDGNVNAAVQPVPQPIAQLNCDLPAVLRTTTEVTAKTGEGWIVRLNTKSDLGELVDTLFLTLENKIPSRTTLQYIDLRFLPKVFYR